MAGFWLKTWLLHLAVTCLFLTVACGGGGMNKLDVKMASETSPATCEARGKCVNDPDGLVLYNTELITDNLVLKQSSAADSSLGLVARVMNLVSEPELLLISEKIKPVVQGVALVSEFEHCDSPKGINGANPTAGQLRQLKEGRYKACVVYMGEGYQKRILALNPIDVDLTKPQVAGSITVSAITPTSANISWSKAGDNLTLDPNLVYRVFVSDTEPLTSLDVTRRYGRQLAGQVKDMTTYAMTGLVERNQYHVAVVVSDEAGNDAFVGNANFATTASDTTRPTVTISSNRDSGPTNLTSILLTIEFSENVTGFDSADLVVTGATKGTFAAVDQKTFTQQLTATGSLVTAAIASLAAEDATGNKSVASNDWSLIINGAVATPTFSVAAGGYGPAQTVTLSTATEGATIYYTTNGTDPTAASTVYSTAITVSSTSTIKALATKANFTDSAIASAAYTINGAVATPTASPAAGIYTTAQSVTLSSATAGASIYYTLDGSNPTTSSTPYSTPVFVGVSQTIKAIALKSAYVDSNVGTFGYTITGTVQAPTFSVAAGAYGPTQTVTLSSATPGATIYYTTNGSNPTTSSTQYSGAITVSTSQTIKAFALLTNWADSSIASAAYTINGAVATPTFSVAAGGYGPAQTVTLSTATAGATIYYTTNGTDPTAASPVYSTAITVSSTSTIKALATKANFSDSAVASAAYTINGAVASPTFSVTPGLYNSTQSVTLSSATTGATIYYTTNGSTPTAASLTYTGSVSVSSSQTIKAIATKTGFSDSSVASASYTIDTVVPTVTTFARALGQSATSNSLPINFTIVFSEPINAATFTVADISNGGTATGVTWTVTDSGDQVTWTVAATASSQGTITPVLRASAVTDVAGNSSTSSTTIVSSSVTYDTAPPTILISAPSVNYANSSSTVTYTITYGGASSVTLTTSNITLNTTSTATASVAVTGSGSTSRTVTLTSLTGSGTVGISLAAGTASDLAGNSALAAGPSLTVTVDNAATIGDPLYSGVALLLNMEEVNASTAFTDGSMYNQSLTVNGSAQISTAQKKYGASSGYFDGSTASLRLSSSLFDVSSSDATIEFWFYASSTTAAQMLFEIGSGGTGDWQAYIEGGVVKFGTSLNASQATLAVSANTWNHLAAVKSGTDIFFFLNGSKSTVLTRSTSTSSALNIASRNNASMFFGGYIDDFRVTRGVARYTANFIVPSKAFANFESSASVDPYYAKTSVLLHMDGSNGSTSFTDRGPNGLTVTANGSAQISTSQGNFGGASGSFANSNSYLQLSNQSLFNFSSSDFTIEGWIYVTSSLSSSVIIAKNEGSYTTGYEWWFGIGNNYPQFTFVNNAATFFTVASNTPLTLNSWTHLAVVRSGTVISIYQNGISVGSTTAQTIRATSSNVTVGRDLENLGGGRFFNGFIDDLRITNGVARYVASFTPPAKAFADPLDFTSLSLDGTNFTDKSKNNFTITQAGDVTSTSSVQLFGKNVYSFDGNEDWLQPPNDNAFVMGTGDFTAESWVNFGAIARTDFFDNRPDSSNGAYMLVYLDAGGYLVAYLNEGIRISGASGSVQTNTWYHWALSRSNGITRLFLNGVQQGSDWVDSTNYLAPSTRGPRFGRSAYGGIYAAALNGYMTGIQVLKGYGKYQSDFSSTFAPGQPTNLAGSTGINQVGLTWTAPASGASAITNYYVRYSSDSGSTWSTPSLTGSTNASYTVTGLAGGTSYIFQVAAVNAMASGNYSASSGGVTTIAECSNSVSSDRPNDCYNEGTSPNYAQGLAIGTLRAGPSGSTLTLQYATGSSGFKIWKEQGGSRILNATGLVANAWQQTLTRAGTAFSGSNFTIGSNIAGRVCPTNVFLGFNNMVATSRCLYYDGGNAYQTLDGAGTSLVEAEDWLQYWSRAATGRGAGSSYFEGNLKVCADKGMRLPTMYETTMDKPDTGDLPTGDGLSPDPSWAGINNGVPVSGGWSWTASALGWQSNGYWRWSGTSRIANTYFADYGIRCVLP